MKKTKVGSDLSPIDYYNFRNRKELANDANLCLIASEFACDNLDSFNVYSLSVSFKLSVLGSLGSIGESGFHGFCGRDGKFNVGLFDFVVVLGGTGCIGGVGFIGLVGGVGGVSSKGVLPGGIVGTGSFGTDL